MQDSIVIVGAGAWGTALGISLAHAGNNVILIARHAALAQAINEARENTRYVPGVTLPATLVATADPAQLQRARICLFAVPAQATRATLDGIQFHLLAAAPLILCSKGLELETGLRQSEIAQDTLPGHPCGVLSGPSFASEVAANLPAAVVVAAPDMASAESYAAQLATPNLRPYAQADMIGVELAGALKNVLAIGAGIVMGAGLGENARAALITRGLAEITRLGVAAGAKASTFAGLAGMGDVMLTCGSATSRNFAFGRAIGRGEIKPPYVQPEGKTVEGLPTIHAALKLAKTFKTDMPLVNALDALINGGAPLQNVLREILARPLRIED